MTQNTLSRTHLAFFTDLVEKQFRTALIHANGHTNVDALIALIDFRDYGKRFGEEALKHCTYSDLKYADKVLSDERVLRATLAIESAMALVAPTADDAKNLELMAQYLTSGVLDPVVAVEAIADSDDAVQTRAFQLMHERK